MKNLYKLFGIIASVAVIGFLATACPADNEDSGSISELSGTIIISPATGATTASRLRANYSGSESVYFQWYKDGSADFDGDGYGNPPWGDACFPSEAGNYTVTVSADGYKSKTSNAVSVQSVDISWTLVTDHPAANYYFNKIRYGNGKFVVCGHTGRNLDVTYSLIYSSDGETWQELPLSGTGLNSISFIDYAENKFIVGGYNDNYEQRLAYSDDGENWQTLPYNDISGTGTNIISIVYTGGKFFALGRYDSNYHALIAYSDNFATWQVSTTDFPSNWFNNIAYNGTTFVAVKDRNGIAYSNNGETWTMVKSSEIPYDFGNGINGIAYGAGYFVAVGMGVYSSPPPQGIIKSSNGETWSNTWGATGSDIAYGENIFVAVGTGGSFSYSTYGDYFRPGKISVFGTVDVEGIAYGDGIFVVVGDGKIAYSNNQK